MESTFTARISAFSGMQSFFGVRWKQSGTLGVPPVLTTCRHMKETNSTSKQCHEEKHCTRIEIKRFRKIHSCLYLQLIYSEKPTVLQQWRWVWVSRSSGALATHTAGKLHSHIRTIHFKNLEENMTKWWVKGLNIIMTEIRTETLNGRFKVQFPTVVRQWPYFRGTHLSHRDIFNVFHEHNFPERPLLLVHLLFFFGGWSRAPSFYKVESIYP